jgi:tetratricopeptide (TPR) repeat protein
MGKKIEDVKDLYLDCTFMIQASNLLEIDPDFERTVSEKSIEDYKSEYELELKKNQLNPNLWAFFGQYYKKKKSYEEAEKNFKKAIELNPKHWVALKNYGLMLIKIDRIEEGIKYLKLELEFDPYDPVTLEEISAAYDEVGRVDEAVELLMDTWELDLKKDYIKDLLLYYAKELGGEKYKELLYELGYKGEFEYWIELGNILIDEKNYTQAASIFNQFIEYDEKNAEAWSGLAKSFLNLHEFSKSEEAANKALAINPHNPAHWKIKADISYAKEDYEGTLIAAEHGIELISAELDTIKENKKDPSIQTELAALFTNKIDALVKLKRIEEALDILAKARNDFPKVEFFYLYTSVLFLFLGKADDALKILNETDKLGLAKGQKMSDMRQNILSRISKFG